MYSSTSSVYLMRAKAGKERTVIDQPCLCIFGTAVPKHFYEAISPRLMTNGFLARMLILESQKRGQGREATVGPIPDSILDTARWWANFQPGAADNLSAWHLVPQLVHADDEALGVLRAFREYADWAGAFVARQTTRMLAMLARYASESEFDAKRKRLLDVLTKWQAQHGDEWMPFWTINRKLPWSNREHEEVRATLLEQRLIEARTVKMRGRPGAVYRLLPTTPSEEDTS